MADGDVYSRLAELDGPVGQFEIGVSDSTVSLTELNGSTGPAVTVPKSHIVAVFPIDTTQSRIVYVDPTPTSTDQPDPIPTLHQAVVVSSNKTFMSEYQAGPGLANQTISVIVSVKSGKCQALRTWTELVCPFLSCLGGNVDKVCITSSASSVVQFVRQNVLPRSERGESQKVILMSGDGGVADLINALAGGLDVEPVRTDGSTHSTRNSVGLVWKSSNPTPPSGYTPPEIVILPLGTGNALANSAWAASRDGKRQLESYVDGTALGSVLFDPTAGLSTLARGKADRMTIGTVTFSGNAEVEWGYSDGDETDADKTVADETDVPTTDKTLLAAVVVSWGIHASLVAASDRPEYRVFGSDRFQMAAIELLFPQPPKQVEKYIGQVSIHNSTIPPRPGLLTPTSPASPTSNEDDKWTKIEDFDHMYVLTTTCSLLERGFLISPASIEEPSKFHLVRFGTRSGKEAMDTLMAAYERGKHLSKPGVEYLSIDKIRIQFGNNNVDGNREWEEVCVDGRIVKVKTGGQVEWSLIEPDPLSSQSDEWVRIVKLD